MDGAAFCRSCTIHRDWSKYSSTISRAFQHPACISFSPIMQLHSQHLFPFPLPLLRETDSMCISLGTHTCHCETSTLRTLSGHWLICRREPICGQHLVAIFMCHEHAESSEIEHLPLRPHACEIVYLLTSNSTGQRQYLSLSNAV